MLDMLIKNVMHDQQRNCGRWNSCCPRCGEFKLKNPIHTNALSRRGNFYVCDDCGTLEAVEDFTGKKTALSEYAACKYYNTSESSHEEVHKYYFTFGSNEHYPYQGGWVEIVAPDQNCAISIFKALYPNPIDGHEDILNCCSIYHEKQFKTLKMYTNGNLGARCHEIITLIRKVGENNV